MICRPNFTCNVKTAGSSLSHARLSSGLLCPSCLRAGAGRFRSATSLLLHASGVRLGFLHFRSYSQLGKPQSVRSELISGGKRRGRNVGEFIPDCRRAHHQLISSSNGSAVWAQKLFGMQAAICAVVFPIIIVLQLSGRRLRAWSGEL